MRLCVFVCVCVCMCMCVCVCVCTGRRDYQYYNDNVLAVCLNLFFISSRLNVPRVPELNVPFTRAVCVRVLLRPVYVFAMLSDDDDDDDDDGSDLLGWCLCFVLCRLVLVCEPVVK